MNKAILFTLKFTLSVLFFYCLSNFVDFNESIQLLSSFDINLFIYLCLLLLIILILSAFKWIFFSRQLKIYISKSNAIRIIMCGHFFNQILPTSIGGDAYRVLALKRTYKLSFTNAASSVFGDRIVGLLLFIVFFFIAFLVDDQINSDIFIQGFFFTLLFFLLALSISCFFLYRLKIHTNLNHFLPKILLYTKKLISCFRLNKNFFSFIALSFTIQLTNIFIFYFLFHYFNQPISFIQCLGLVSLSLIASALPLSISGWGVRESSLLFMVSLVVVGYDPAVIILISLLYGLVNLVTGLFGFFFLNFKRL